jgi:UDP-N-acetylglucosamine 1-carboxyvinyltransferase
MKQIRIQGGNYLKGTIRISGAKNSAVALVPASLLSDELVNLDNVPNISDIDALNEILVFLGAKVSRRDELMIIDSSTVESKSIPENISKKLRASYYFMGALLGKYKK